MATEYYFPSPDKTGAVILVVDDEHSALDLIALVLERAGFEVWKADSASVALSMIEKRGVPHLALVDILMPGTDGITFCATVQRFVDLPVIMLTALDQPQTKVKCIEEYAEDYITKPFIPSELVARVRRVLRRMGDYAYVGGALHIDDRLTLELTRRRATVAGQIVTFTPAQNKILHVLVSNFGRTVATSSLLQRVWFQKEVYEDALRVHIHRLRQKIERDPARPCYILTDRGLGYRFSAGSDDHSLTPAVFAPRNA